MLRKNFSLKARKKGDPPTAAKLWNGKSLLRKYNDVVKREILRDYETVFQSVTQNGKLPSGKQLEDLLLEIRMKLYELKKASPAKGGDEDGESCILY